MRVAVVGPPCSGKTTLALEMGERLGIDPRHTDDLRRPDNRWGKQAEQAYTWMQEPGPWITEGVTTLLALHLGATADVLIYLPNPLEPLSYGQQRLADDVAETWRDLETGDALVLVGSDAAYDWISRRSKHL